MQDSEFPVEVRIENTNVCNADCTICPREKLTRKPGIMPLGDFEKLIDECSENGVKEVHVHGFGEVFLDREIFKKIEYAKSKGINKTYLVTNASLIDEEKAENIVKSGLDAMKISFYGTGKGQYESIHKNLDYDEVKKNIENLFGTRRRLKSKTPRIRIQFIGSLPDSVVFFLKWIAVVKNPLSIGFNKLHNYGRGRSFVNIKKDKKRICKIVQSSIMQILWDGSVVPCCYDFNGEMILGNVSEKSLKEIWNDCRYKIFRKIHENQEFNKLPICNACDQLK